MKNTFSRQSAHENKRDLFCRMRRSGTGRYIQLSLRYLATGIHVFLPFRRVYSSATGCRICKFARDREPGELASPLLRYYVFHNRLIRKGLKVEINEMWGNLELLEIAYVFDLVFIYVFYSTKLKIFFLS